MRFVNIIKSTTPGINTPIGTENLFCVDNEAFVHLVAHLCGVPLNSKETKESELSWKKSLAACKRYFYLN